MYSTDTAGDSVNELTINRSTIWNENEREREKTKNTYSQLGKCYEYISNYNIEYYTYTIHI